VVCRPEILASLVLFELVKAVRSASFFMVIQLECAFSNSAYFSFNSSACILCFLVMLLPGGNGVPALFSVRIIFGARKLSVEQVLIALEASEVALCCGRILLT
jgi:hypothetical protein